MIEYTYVLQNLTYMFRYTNFSLKTAQYAPKQVKEMW